MNKTPSSSRKYRFGPFELDPRTAELRRDGERLPLQPQPAAILTLLVRRAGELVTREEIQAAIWPDRIVDYEQGLNYAIRQIRSVLGDDAERPLYVETLPRRGYRFVGRVQRVNAAAQPGTGPRRVLAYALGGILMAVGAVVSLARLDRDSPVPEPPRIAVLPFDNLGPEASDTLLARAVTEQFITDLAQIDPERLGVIARTSSERFGAGDRPIERIGDALGADYVLEGSIRRDKGAIRITTQLVRVADRVHVWTGTRDGSTAKALEVPGELGREMIAAIVPEAMQRRAVREATLPIDPVPRESYLVARGLLDSRDPAVLEQARLEFQRTLASEPGFAPALVGLGEAFLRSGEAGNAREPLERALEIDPEDARAHNLLAQVLLFHDWEWEAAERHLDEALALKPGLAAAHQVRAYWLVLNGRMSEAGRAMETALRLDPLSSYVQADAGWIDYWAGRLDRAAARCARTLELDPGNRSGQTCRLFVAIARGDEAAARGAARALMEARGATTVEFDALDSVSGLEPYWSWEIHRLTSESERSANDAFLIALAYAQLGREAEAFPELEAAWRGRTPWMLWLEIEPLLEPLRDDPRWTELVRRMDFPRAIS